MLIFSMIIVPGFNTIAIITTIITNTLTSTTSNGHIFQCITEPLHSLDSGWCVQVQQRSSYCIYGAIRMPLCAY